MNYTCNICDYNTMDGDELREHKRSVHEEHRYTCDKCEFRTTQKNNLKTHKDLLHKGKETLNQNEPNIVDFIKRMRSENDRKTKNTENATKNTEEDNDDTTSTQNMIIDARTRKQLKERFLNATIVISRQDLSHYRRNTNICEPQ